MPDGLPLPAAGRFRCSRRDEAPNELADGFQKTAADQNFPDDPDDQYDRVWPDAPQSNFAPAGSGVNFAVGGQSRAGAAVPADVNPSFAGLPPDN